MDPPGEPPQLRSSPRELALQLRLEVGDQLPHPGKALLGTVAQFQLEATALLVAGLDDPSPRLLYLGNPCADLHLKRRIRDRQSRCRCDSRDEAGIVQDGYVVDEDGDSTAVLVDRCD